MIKIALHLYSYCFSCSDNTPGQMPIWRGLAGACALSLLGWNPVHATETETEEFQPFTQTIDRIIIITGDVFDLSNPKENKSLYRLANTIHINTQEEVVRQFLLFQPGDVLSIQKLAESERILRELTFIHDASVKTINIRPDKVDILVKTRDNWTLAPGINLSREGGSNSSSVNFVESNLLGYGKTLAMARSHDAERTSSSFHYRDPNLLGSRHVLDILYSNNSDGLEAGITFQKPFFSLAAQIAYGFSFNIQDLNEDLNDPLGNKVAYKGTHDKYESSLGYSYNLSKIRSIRISFGYTLKRDILQPIGGVGIEQDNTDSYIWAGSQYLEDRYIKMQRIQLLNQTEDINLGHSASTRIGWSHENIGSDFTGVIFQGGYSYNAIIGAGKLYSQDINIETKLHDNRIAESKYSTEIRYYHTVYDDINNFVRFHLDLGRDLLPADEFYLGGESGIRGYPTKFQSGDKRLLLNLEQRYYTNWHVFQLYYMAALIFTDVGRAWSTGDPSSGTQGVLKDIGFGLRAASSRSSTDNVIQFDVAFPLDRNDQIDRYEVVVKASGNF